MLNITLIFLTLALLMNCNNKNSNNTMVNKNLNDSLKGENMQSTDKVVKSEDEWKQILTPEQYKVMREKGTERACSGQFWDNHEVGTYYCAACGQELFTSDTKFESGTGWPSFFQPVKKENIEEEIDNSFGMTRTEIRCSSCGGHLGHVFNDGPEPTGLRYCINSVSLNFKAK